LFEVFIPKGINAGLSRDYSYMLLQTMRIINRINIFHRAATAISLQPRTITHLKMIDELELQHGANLYEVINQLFQKTQNQRALYRMYCEAVKGEETIRLLDELKDDYDRSSKEVRVLEAIRNKHAMHVPIDRGFTDLLIAGYSPGEDTLVGLGESKTDWFFTFDTAQLYEFIQKTLLSDPSEKVAERIFEIIREYNKRLHNLFSLIATELFGGVLGYREGSPE
jgi:hypothetical protein